MPQTGVMRSWHWWIKWSLNVRTGRTIWHPLPCLINEETETHREDETCLRSHDNGDERWNTDLEPCASFWLPGLHQASPHEAVGLLPGRDRLQGGSRLAARVEETAAPASHLLKYLFQGILHTSRQPRASLVEVLPRSCQLPDTVWKQERMKNSQSWP